MDTVPFMSPLLVPETDLDPHTAADIRVIKGFLDRFADTPNTERAYRRELVRFLLWMTLVARTNLDKIGREEIEAFVRFCETPPATWIETTSFAHGHPRWRPFRKPMDAHALNHTRGMIKSVFDWLVLEHYLPGNPVAALRNKRAVHDPRSGMRHQLPDSALSFVWRAIDAHPIDTPRQARERARRRLAILIFLHTAARRSEAASLRYSSLSVENGRQWFTVIGKGMKAAYLPVTPTLARAMAEYRQVYGINPSLEDDVPLIGRLSDPLSPITDNMLYRIIKDTFEQGRQLASEEGDMAAAALLGKGSPHWLRHTAIGRAVKETGDLVFGQRIGRHADISTTAGYSKDGEDQFHDKLSATFEALFPERQSPT